MPALFTKMSMRPPRTPGRLLSQIPRCFGRSVEVRRHEVCTATSGPDAFDDRRAAFDAASADDDVGPSAPNAMAMARPMLLVAPVISAVFPSSRVPMSVPFVVVDLGADSPVQKCSQEFWTTQSRKPTRLVVVSAAAKLTPKGAATRERIVASSADLVLARGVGGTTLDDIRAGTATSKSQLFHYFPGGKAELVGAIASFQGERVLDAQRPYLDSLDPGSAWEGWRRAVLDHYGSQAHWGCPISALAREVIGNDPEHAAELAAYMDRWRGYLQAGLERMRSQWHPPAGG